MPKRSPYDMSREEASLLKQGEFKGIVIQSLADIRSDISELKGNQRDQRLLTFFIAGISGIVTRVLEDVLGVRKI